ncbi:phosphoadenosine phosphosulfate reductase family protein [Erythrobacter aureus]|nr:phosphoadenosine phosphosulfate reductase family protein [Erythrobacter aureus]
MAFDHAEFERRGVELPRLFPAEEQAGFAFADDDALPDPMDLVRQGALVVASHSGGKDGQAMLVHLVERLKVPTSQIVCIHADLGEAEWEGTADHARANAEAYGIPFLVCKAQNKDGEAKDLLDYVDQRGQFMSSSARFCTSDWKRGPIRRTINAYREEIGHTSPYVLNCMGLRGEESSARAKLEPLQFVKSASCPPKPYPEILEAETRATRRVFFDWHPIHHFSEEQVFATIAAGGQDPHWAYTTANARRLSCLVCIFSQEQDILAAVKHSSKGREYARRVIALEEKHDHTILPLKSMGRGKPPVKRWLKDIVGDLLDEAA